MRVYLLFEMSCYYASFGDSRVSQDGSQNEGLTRDATLVTVIAKTMRLSIDSPHPALIDLMMPLDEQVNEEIVESLNILIDTKNIMSLKHRRPENTEASSFLLQKRAS